MMLLTTLVPAPEGFAPKVFAVTLAQEVRSFVEVPAARTWVKRGLEAAPEGQLVGREVLSAPRILLCLRRAQTLPPDFTRAFERDRPCTRQLGPRRLRPIFVFGQGHDDRVPRPQRLLEDV